MIIHVQWTFPGELTERWPSVIGIPTTAITPGNRTSKVIRYYRQKEIVYVLIMKRLINSTPHHRRRQRPPFFFPRLLTVVVSYDRGASQIQISTSPPHLIRSLPSLHKNTDRYPCAQMVYNTNKVNYLANISTCPTVAVSHFTIRIINDH